MGGLSIKKQEEEKQQEEEKHKKNKQKSVHKGSINDCCGSKSK